jgi:arsenate-mycothiol transferase
MVQGVDLAVTLGREAKAGEVEGTRFENWDSAEPANRGIDGVERMRLIRDDIVARVTKLAQQLPATTFGLGCLRQRGVQLGLPMGAR